MNATWYLGDLFAVAFRTPYLRCLVLGHSFGALEGLAAFFTMILVGRHVSPPQPVNSRSIAPCFSKQVFRARPGPTSSYRLKRARLRNADRLGLERCSSCSKVLTHFRQRQTSRTGADNAKGPLKGPYSATQLSLRHYSRFVFFSGSGSGTSNSSRVHHVLHRHHAAAGGGCQLEGVVRLLGAQRITRLSYAVGASGSASDGSLYLNGALYKVLERTSRQDVTGSQAGQRGISCAWNLPIGDARLAAWPNRSCNPL